MRFVFAVLALLMIPLRASAFAAPATAQFVGWWTVSAGDRNLLVLHVVAENDGRLAGELWRPSYFEVSPGTVGSIRGPVLRESASDLKLEEGGLTFTAANPRDAKDSDRWLLKIASSGEAALMFEAFQTLPMKAVRGDAAAMAADDWLPDQSYKLAQVGATADVGPNSEMARIFEADQAARKPAKIDWTVVSKEDAARRRTTTRLLNIGALNTADDYYRAALIFQHGSQPSDYLLAHTLAIVALKMGRQDATWIACATLDRYLQASGGSQIYGTQFRSNAGVTTQDPYDRSLVPDALRAQLYVPSQAAQEAQRRELERQQGKP